MDERPNQRVDPNNPYPIMSYFNDLKTIIADKFKQYEGIISVFLRFPSIILADLILNNTNVILEYLEIKLAHHLNIILFYLLSKFIFLTLIFFCCLVFLLDNYNIMRIYKIIGLISQPFLFSYLYSFNEINIFSVHIPRNYFVYFIYLEVTSLTIYFYYDIYYKFIQDKYEIYRYYQFYNNRGEETLFLELLTNHGYKNVANVVRQDHEVRERVQELDLYLNETNSLFAQGPPYKIYYRLIYILSYSILSYVINEKIIDPKTDEKFNIISLGYLILLTYDLTANLDQMLLRLLLRIKILARKLFQGVLLQVMWENWFNRLKIPLCLKIYFLIQFVIFSLNFVKYKSYYYAMDRIVLGNGMEKSKSLFSYIAGLFFKKFDSDNYDKNEQKFLFTSTISQLVSLFSKTEIIIKADSVDLKLINQILIYVKFLILNQTNTLISVLCTTTAISYKFHLIGICLSKLISLEEENVENPEDIRNIGQVTAVLFFLLNLQSNITSLTGFERIEKFYRNYSLLFIAVLHYYHGTVDHKLTALRTMARNVNNRSEHIRTLTISLFLIVIPILILSVIWKYFPISTWLLSASAFNIELIVKVIVSLLMYLVNCLETMQAENDAKKDDVVDYDSTQELNFYDKYDTYIYYIKAFGHVFEFFVAIFLFVNGAYILFFESYGAIRAIMMCLHAYFHIWSQAWLGWNSFKVRRQVIQGFRQFRKFNGINYKEIVKRKYPELNEDQLTKEYDEKLCDNCAICLDEIRLQVALITRCDHVFHFTCLRRWLYEHRQCPVCKKDAYEGN
ncbi:unnamed protein product [Brachionus calyciflorus]|uniref:RING-type domain-containing protein n=1 Tax=Brachionus calyciflorus TaxID=104777 RepID=A0A813ZFX5_9BILA|nr:unnamed protein product [Brachionus calyciflorus]